MLQIVKRCTLCGCEKPLEAFGAHKLGRFGRQSRCRECANALTSAWRSRNKEQISAYNREYRAANPSRDDSAYKREWYLRNRERIAANGRARRRAADEAARARRRERRANNRDHVCEINRKWREANRDRLREAGRKRKARPQVKIENAVREGVRRGIADKGGMPTFALLGYSCAALMAHLERQFQRGMSWDNYGEWHIDHIVPLSSFAYETPDDPDFRRAWALTNLRPIWGRENLAKGAKRLTLL